MKETLGRCCPLLGDMQKKDPKEQEFPPLSTSVLAVDAVDAVDGRHCSVF